MNEDTAFLVGHFGGPVETSAHRNHPGIFDRLTGLIDYENGGRTGGADQSEETEKKFHLLNG